MTTDMAPDQTVRGTRGRILEAARQLLGQRPDAGMGEIAAAASVVRRTVYGYFPARADLIRALAHEAAAEMRAALRDLDRPSQPADEVWTHFVRQLWPLVGRYRVLLALRGGDHGKEIHAVLRSVDAEIAGLIGRGQDDGIFETHLPPDQLARLSTMTVFTIADDQDGAGSSGVDAAVTTSLLLLGVTTKRAGHLIKNSQPL